MANNDNSNTEGMIEDLDASFYDYTLEKKNQVLMLKLLVCHQFKKVSSRDKISYGRNKLKQIQVDIEEKVVQALDILAEELQPEKRVD